MIMMIFGGLYTFLPVKIWKVFPPHAWLDFFIDAGDFTRLPGEREK